MSENRLPSMTALLGLLALAGYQNRDKIAEWLNSAKQPDSASPPASDMPSQAGGILGGLAGAGGIGGLLNGGLGELIDRFKQAGHAEKADSWVRQGPNQEVAPQEFESAIGPDVIDALVRQTGLSKDELLSRLSRQVPEAVDRYTPDGRLGTAGA
ncbi:YidB family protein [Bosea sp. (in: a-proteobacteria)]|uniref:YidB family protein n=1 Tax=Bosea sp. (in: a-proteobacteria) TaxID=1871050 RepID=UPI002FC92D3F